MKKIYFTILAMGTFGMVYGQGLNPASENSNETYELMEMEAPRDNAPKLTSRGGGDLWSEDFANGFNSENGLWTVGGPNGNVWKHATTIWSGCYATGAQGSLEFTTLDNGFMLFHADSVNCVDPEPATPVITEVPLTGELISPSIDLSGVSAVSISFEHRFRYCCQTLSLLLSVTNDGGETWTDYEVTANTVANEYNSNTTHQVNISQVAADQSDVQIKFTWNADGTSSHYTWSIDDIALFTPNDYDLGMADAHYSAWDFNTAEDFGDLPFTIYPISQLRELTFRATVTNYGGMEQNDVQLVVVVTDEGGAEVATLESDVETFASGEQKVLTIGGFTPPAEVGEYTISYELVSGAEDNNPEDNVAPDMTFQVSDDVFARDRGSRSGEFSNYDDYYKVGNWFNMNSEEEVYCLGAALSNASVPGTFYTMQLLDADRAFLAETEYVGVPEAQFLNGTGEGHFTYAWMNSMVENDVPFTLQPGDVFAALNHDGGPDAVNVATSGSSFAQTSLMWEGTEGVDGTWYYLTSTPMVRIGLSYDFCHTAISVGVEEIEQVSAHKLFPNPTAGHSTLEYTLLESSDVQIMLFDLQGRVLLNEDLGTQSVGEYRYNFDLTDRAAGMYTFSLVVNGQSINKQLVVK